MTKQYLSTFNTRQFMVPEDFEIFYYEDKKLSNVSIHQHDFYEIYFFISGNMDILIGNHQYKLSYGDIGLIPPSIEHKAVFQDDSIPYRRIVVWISPSYLDKLDKMHPGTLSCFEQVAANKQYHLSTDFSSAQLLFSKLFAIIEEFHTFSYFHQPLLDCSISSFFLTLNRTIYNMQNPTINNDQMNLFTQICNYISSHLEGDLTLEAISNQFNVSKCYVAHLFKQSMGLSTHQYILRMRLHATKNGIHSGMPLQNVCQNYGFKDYTSFFRAFKKEFGMSPREFKDKKSLTPTPYVLESNSYNQK